MGFADRSPEAASLDAAQKPSRISDDSAFICEGSQLDKWTVTEARCARSSISTDCRAARQGRAVPVGAAFFVGVAHSPEQDR